MKNLLQYTAIALVSIVVTFLVITIGDPKGASSMLFSVLAERHDNLILVDYWDKDNGNDMFYLYLSQDGTEAHVIFHGGKDGSTHWGNALDACDEILLHHEEEMKHVQRIVFHCCYPARQFRVGAGEYDILCYRGEDVDCSIYRSCRKDGFDIVASPLYAGYRKVVGI